MPRSVRFLGFLILGILIALIGTAFLEHTLWRTIPVHTGAGVIAKEWVLSVLCAGLLGFAVQRTWRNSASVWVWVPLAVIFGLRLILAVASGAGWRQQLMGSGCAALINSMDCGNFFAVTVPFIRGISYSLGAYVCSLLRGERPSPASIVYPPTP